MSDSKNRPFVERLAQHLHADRKTLGKSARYRDSADTRHVRRNRKDVCQVHLVRIVGSSANLEGNGWRSRRDDCIDLLEGAVEILLDQRPHLLRLDVIRV